MKNEKSKKMYKTDSEKLQKFSEKIAKNEIKNALKNAPIDENSPQIHEMYIMKVKDGKSFWFDGQEFSEKIVLYVGQQKVEIGYRRGEPQKYSQLLFEALKKALKEQDKNIEDVIEKVVLIGGLTQDQVNFFEIYFNCEVYKTFQFGLNVQIGGDNKAQFAFPQEKQKMSNISRYKREAFINLSEGKIDKFEENVNLYFKTSLEVLKRPFEKSVYRFLSNHKGSNFNIPENFKECEVWKNAIKLWA